MEEHQEGDKPAPPGGSQQPPIDPLRRVFVPTETPMSIGGTTFRTSDREIYVRLPDGSIRSTKAKARGKAARRADKLARRTA